METKQKIKETFEVLDQIKEIEVPAFFSHKVLQKIKNQKEEQEKNIFWFTPKLQLASLVIVLMINVSAILYVFNSSSNLIESESSIETFAKSYNLQTDSNSILN